MEVIISLEIVDIMVKQLRHSTQKSYKTGRYLDEEAEDSGRDFGWPV